MASIALDVRYDYSIDRIVSKNYEDSQGYIQAALAEALPLVPVHIAIAATGRSHAWCV
ncbi:MAG: hypothetical protein IKG22_00720 [Atopobiaceae bacterium]|nr:hypothetical protein [Atopobiaceae bacterium]